MLRQAENKILQNSRKVFKSHAIDLKWRNNCAKRFAKTGAFQNVRGTHDILPETKQGEIFSFIQETAVASANTYGYSKIETPIIEQSGLYTKTLGTDTDVVGKEMYKFSTNEDEDGTLCLRPEGTASVVRSYLNHLHTVRVNQRLYYYGPMFRHERPQKGRYRQFHQFGVEWLGVDHFHSDVESIEMAFNFLKALGLEKQVVLELNTLGTDEDRAKYRAVLQEYLTKYSSQLSPVSRERLARGSVLRVLDSKEEQDQKVVYYAPKIYECLDPKSLKRFEGVLEGLNWLKIPYQITPYLVRGLDYYCHTTFEFKVYSDKKNSRGTVLAGGRYDGLVELMRGPPTAAIGWAAGIERLALLMEEMNVPIPAKQTAVLSIVVPALSTFSVDNIQYRFQDEYSSSENSSLKSANISSLKREPVVPSPSESTPTKTEDVYKLTKASMNMSKYFRDRGVTVINSFKSRAAKQTSDLVKMGSTVILYFGQDQYNTRTIRVKNLSTSEQEDVPFSELENVLRTKHSVVLKDLPNSVSLEQLLYG